jgi:hypothetical protein
MGELRGLLVVAIFLALLSQITLFPSIDAAQPGQVTLNPMADTYVDSSNPNSNYGGNLFLSVSKYQYVFTTYEKITWLKFNVTSPSNVVVENATLQLEGFTTETYTVYAYACSDTSWNELELTYANMPSYNTTAMDHVTVSASQWYNWAVTDAVRTSSGFVTIVLAEIQPRGTFSNVIFDSKEEMMSFLG